MKTHTNFSYGTDFAAVKKNSSYLRRVEKAFGRPELVCYIYSVEYKDSSKDRKIAIVMELVIEKRKERYNTTWQFDLFKFWIPASSVSSEVSNALGEKDSRLYLDDGVLDALERCLEKDSRLHQALGSELDKRIKRKGNQLLPTFEYNTGWLDWQFEDEDLPKPVEGSIGGTHVTQDSGSASDISDTEIVPDSSMSGALPPSTGRTVLLETCIPSMFLAVFERFLQKSVGGLMLSVHDERIGDSPQSVAGLRYHATHLRYAISSRQISESYGLKDSNLDCGGPGLA
ncbi:hypothetical protein FFLO_05782 [Filobasidium floriforme]|uniref:Uncharacterized protein n=1 Tax=Filobasidium floriforme TaxID=5210 RepID=A0A8K0JGM8_9TREE|nr:uncharacterized protein HD553DRAFT_322808 [Filobasidium floriforme]KAG7529141.1 hypothetical protein FFLO_05782 [Filobasidium floriforme]KAH8087302.1 hypothetical protein HD553DRAFT_322808 [Filobasidium floriforme]